MGLQGFMNKLNEPKNNAAFICINLLLGTGPLIVPEPFFRAGFLFSTLWTILVLAISYNAAVYIGESIELLNSHQS
jgi:amino acid permease